LWRGLRAAILPPNGSPSLGYVLGSAMAARLTLSFVLAYAAGIAFQYFAIAPMRGLSLRAGLLAAVKADTFSLIAYEIGMFAWMIYRAHMWPAMQPTDWSYWLMMQIAWSADLRPPIR
jgi:hypothetical protein